MKQVEHLKNFQVIELRRYTIKKGEREHFAQYFESYFPEAFQQLGALAVGQFFEREKTDHFLWLRAFHDMDDRAKVNSTFYYGPLWKEHKATLNGILDDSDNVLLLRPVDPNRTIKVMPAVDPVGEPGGAHGIVVALIFAVKPNAVEQFAREAEATFAKYRAAGIEEVGLLCTLDAKNNFPQLPVRSDGPFLVWLGLMQDQRTLTDIFVPLNESSGRELQKSQLLTGATELIVLDPTKRSRLRWLPQ
ncbi:MAG: hypothetical protein JWO13_365 [Acidobacteriales bacterium]|nr:hypothetical protein [Terriglobales bacterium]